MIYTDEMEQESSTEKQSDKLLSRQDFFFDRSELDMQRTRGVDVLISNLKRYRKNYKLSGISGADRTGIVFSFYRSHTERRSGYYRKDSDKCYVSRNVLHGTGRQ